MRVLIAPDKFKGTLTAGTAAAAIARGWRRVRPGDVLDVLPLSDGGDGFGSVLAEFRDARRVQTTAVDAAGRRCVVRWWWDASIRMAIIESARVIGLAMLPKGKFHPFELDSRGLAIVVRAAMKRGARRCVIGLGGSATNDGGFGLARGLGWKFFDADGDVIERWTDLAGLSHIEAPGQRCWPGQIIAAVDVQNRLLGLRGCTRVFGPQKGLRSGDFSKCEVALRRLVAVVRRQFGDDFAMKAGAGAAGGLGFGLSAFAGARLESGFDLIAGEARLDARLRRADLVITGEGRLDRSTLMGKGVGELVARCLKQGVPCVALGGCVVDLGALKGKFSSVGVLTDLTTPTRAQREARRWLERLASAAANRIGRDSP